MSLLARQNAFLAEIASADQDGRAPSSTGTEIYRNAYRGRLLGALETSFERTRRWVGAVAFTTAACHYILTRPPCSWSLDLYGSDFPDLLGDLFADDPEVAELAWLEWHMQSAFAALDAPQLDAADLASGDHAPGYWDDLRFDLAAGFATRPITTNVCALWNALSEGDEEFSVTRTADNNLIVWRQGQSPRFRNVDEAECLALASFAHGGTLGDLAQEHSADGLGAWLAHWLGEGLLARGARH